MSVFNFSEVLLYTVNPALQTPSDSRLYCNCFEYSTTSTLPQPRPLQLHQLLLPEQPVKPFIEKNPAVDQESQLFRC